jgi:hypothetical protein
MHTWAPSFEERERVHHKDSYGLFNGTDGGAAMDVVATVRRAVEAATCILEQKHGGAKQAHPWPSLGGLTSSIFGAVLRLSMLDVSSSSLVTA